MCQITFFGIANIMPKDFLKDISRKRTKYRKLLHVKWIYWKQTKSENISEKKPNEII